MLGNIDFEFANPKTARVYVVTLRVEEPSPFPALSDEVTIKKEEPAPAASAKEGDKSEAKDKSKDKVKKEEEKPKAEEKEATKEFKIDLEGIQNRVVALTIPPAQIQTLSAAKDLVLYSTTPIPGLSGPLPGETSAVHAFDLKERKDKVLIRKCGAVCCCPSTVRSCSRPECKRSARLMGRRRRQPPRTYGIIDTKADQRPQKIGDGALNLAGLRAEVDPAQEWKQMFDEVWRQERDYFFAAGD